jgi:predicted MFS family arabinose efflux permease
MIRVHDPAPKQRDRGILAEARSGLLYVFGNRTLTGLALTFFGFTAGWGCLVIAVPVLVLGRLHQGPAAVGYIWGAMGVAGLVSTLIMGRLNTRGRERQLMVGSMLAVAVSMSFLPFASSVLVVAAALVGVALVETPFDIAFLTLRQRRTDPARYGSVFAVSMSLNVLGGPVGSALAGPLIGWSLTGALWAAVVATLFAAALPIFAIPARDERPTV